MIVARTITARRFLRFLFLWNCCHFSRNTERGENCVQVIEKDMFYTELSSRRRSSCRCYSLRWKRTTCTRLVRVMHQCEVTLRRYVDNHYKSDAEDGSPCDRSVAPSTERFAGCFTWRLSVVMQHYQYSYVYAYLDLNNLAKLMDGLGLVLDYILTIFKLLSLWFNRR